MRCIPIMLITCTALAANDITASPLVQEKNNFTKHPWGIYDWATGFIISFYSPLVSLSRGGDCFSQTLAFGVRMGDMPRNFDTGFEVDRWTTWLMIILKLFFTILSIYNFSTTCYAEL